MSEDPPDEPIGGADPAAAPPGTDAPDAAPEAALPIASSSRRRRLVLLAIGALIVVGAAILIARPFGRRAGTAPTIAEGSGRAAVRAPGGPRLGDPAGVRIGGQVVDGAGVPVAGAEVSVELEAGAPDRALAGTAAPAPAVGDAGAGSAAAAAVYVALPTAADGGFAIEGLDPGRYRLRVTGPGLLPAEVRFLPVPSDQVRIVVARRVVVEGTVIDGTTPVADATVGLRGDAIGGELEVRTDAQGAFRFPELPEGRYQLHAWKGALAARAVRVNRLGAGPFSPIELRVEGAAIVVGRVIDREGGAGLVAAVELRPIGDDQAPRYARTGDDGVFRIEGVPHGAWIADAFAPGYTSPGGIDLEAGRGIPELALIRGGAIEGRILDGDGQPITGATVRALGTGPNAPERSAAVDQDRLRRYSGRLAAPAPVTGNFSADPQLLPRGELGVMVGPIPPLPPPGAQAARQASLDPAVARQFAGEPAPLAIDAAIAAVWTTGPDGRYRIPGFSRGKVVVLATAPGFAEGRSKQLAIEPGQRVTNHDIVLTPGTVIVGKVTDQRGGPVIGAQVSAKPELGAPLDAFTDADGSYRLGPLAGTVELVASAYGHGEARRKVELDVATGRTPAEQREDLVLVVADAVLAGTLDDATGATVTAATIEIIGGVADGRSAVVGEDGTFAIDLLAAGPHRVRVTHPAYPPLELETTASTGGRERVRLRLPLGGIAEGVLLDGGSGAPLAGIAISGDGPAGATAETASDPAGAWRLGPLVPGRWRIAIKLPGYLPLARDVEVPVSRAPGDVSVRDLRLELARGALVGGTVRDARGQRAAGAKLAVQLADGTGPIAEGFADTQGEFRVRDCPTGDVTITATRGEARGETRATIRAGDEILGLSVELR